MNECKDEYGRFTTPEFQIENRMGVTVTNKHGTEATIIKYNSATDITIQYENGYEQNIDWRSFFHAKEFRSPLCKTVCGVGYFGIGEYPHSHRSKDMWTQMIFRVYSDKKLKNRPNYIGCSVCEEWHNFQNFAKWYDDNFYQVKNCQMHLDKDILVKNNKIYSPQTCLIVPLPINALTISGKRGRGEYPIGVNLRKESGKLRVNFTKTYLNGIKIKTRRFNFGEYENFNEAFLVYKREKEKYIKEVADYYKDEIPEKVYDALYKYEVEITD